MTKTHELEDRAYALAVRDLTEDVVAILRGADSWATHAQQEELVRDVRRMARLRIARFREALA